MDLEPVALYLEHTGLDRKPGQMHLEYTALHLEHTALLEVVLLSCTHLECVGLHLKPVGLHLESVQLHLESVGLHLELTW